MFSTVVTFVPGVVGGKSSKPTLTANDTKQVSVAVQMSSYISRIATITFLKVDHIYRDAYSSY